MRVGVIGVQGAVSEHIHMLAKLNANPLWVRGPEELEMVSALIIPGGESTTISRLLLESRLFARVKELGEGGLPIFGTCAGLILLAKKGDAQVKKTKQKLLGLMDMKITRNAFGRQRESFEVHLNIGDIADFPCVFIRAPGIEEIYGKCEALARHGKFIVAARQNNFLTTSFHPELTEDARLHEYFLNEVC